MVFILSGITVLPTKDYVLAPMSVAVLPNKIGKCDESID